MSSPTWTEWRHSVVFPPVNMGTPVEADHYRLATPTPIPVDTSVTFRWHWPRGVFDKRMSAMEIATFLLPHMPQIVPLLVDQPVIQAHFQTLLKRLALWSVEALDELATWIKPIIAGEEDDIIQLDINCREPQPSGPVYFLPGATR